MPEVEVGVGVQLLVDISVGVERRGEVAACPLTGSIAPSDRKSVTRGEREPVEVPPGQVYLQTVVVRMKGVVNDGDVAQVREAGVFRVEWSTRAVGRTQSRNARGAGCRERQGRLLEGRARLTYLP